MDARGSPLRVGALSGSMYELGWLHQVSQEVTENGKEVRHLDTLDSTRPEARYPRMHWGAPTGHHKKGQEVIFPPLLDTLANLHLALSVVIPRINPGR